MADLLASGRDEGRPVGGDPGNGPRGHPGRGRAAAARTGLPVLLVGAALAAVMTGGASGTRGPEAGPEEIAGGRAPLRPVVARVDLRPLPRETRVPLPGPPLRGAGVHLVLTGPRGRALHDVDRGLVRRLDTGDAPGALRRVATVPVPGGVVTVREGRARLHRDAVTDLGPAVTAYRGDRPGTVWLATRDRLRLVGPGGVVLVEGPVPGDRELLTGTPLGLLTRRAPAVLELWDPLSRRVTRSVTRRGVLEQAVGNAVLWTDLCRTSGPCPSRVTDLRTGREQPLVPPDGVLARSRPGLSPDGRHYALVVDPDPHDRLPRAVLAVGTLGTASLRLLDGWEGRGALPPGTRPAWSSSGWVLLALREPGQLIAARAQDHAVTPLPLLPFPVGGLTAG